MKKIIVAALTLAMSFSAIGCSESGSNSQNNDKLKVSITQFAEHGSLDNCRNGFIEGLKEEGFVEGENIEIVYKNANADTANANQIAQSFVSEKSDLICAIATPSAQACYNAIDGTDIPLIYTAVTDPVVAQLSKEDKLSDKNATGTSDKLPIAEQLKMIREFMPEAKKIGILYSTSETNSEVALKEYKEICGEYGFEIVESGINQSADIPMAVADLVTKVDCLSNLTDNTVVNSLPTVLDAANKANIPVFGSEIEQVKNGCAAAAGLDYIELGKTTGQMAAKVLKGEVKANEMEYKIIEHSDIYVNSQVLSALGFNVPESIKESVKEAE